MLSALLAVAAHGTPGVVAPPVASLRVVDDAGAEVMLQIEPSAGGYRFDVECVRKCTTDIRYSTMIGERPLGLFKPWDGDDLVYSVWSAGSTYKVRIWSVSAGGVTQVLEASSHARPEFLNGDTGVQVVRTFDLDRPGEPLRAVSWRYEAGTFKRVGAVR